jgi:hypothetical protein
LNARKRVSSVQIVDPVLQPALADGLAGAIT